LFLPNNQYMAPYIFIHVFRKFYEECTPKHVLWSNSGSPHSVNSVLLLSLNFLQLSLVLAAHYSPLLQGMHGGCFWRIVEADRAWVRRRELWWGLELQLWAEAVGKTAVVELKIKRPTRRFWKGRILEKKNRAREQVLEFWQSRQ
jgi:hypothetical protein